MRLVSSFAVLRLPAVDEVRSDASLLYVINIPASSLVFSTRYSTQEQQLIYRICGPFCCQQNPHKLYLTNQAHMATSCNTTSSLAPQRGVNSP